VAWGFALGLLAPDCFRVAWRELEVGSSFRSVYEQITCINVIA
jgi:hypothetical protein